MTHEHEVRIATADRLAREIADLLLASGVCPELLPENWSRATALGRVWFKDYCPRYERDRVETELVWIGTAMLTLDRLRERTRRPEKHPDYLPFAEVPALFRAIAASHWRNVADTYVRHCERIDTHEPAERQIAQIARRVAARSLQPVAV